MPIYEYECNACNEQFERLVTARRDDEGAKCPACGSTDTRRIPSTFAVGRSKQPQSSCTTCCPGGTCGL